MRNWQECHSRLPLGKMAGPDNRRTASLGRGRSSECNASVAVLPHICTARTLITAEILFNSSNAFDVTA